jgi:hypothetical protein
VALDAPAPKAQLGIALDRRSLKLGHNERGKLREQQSVGRSYHADFGVKHVGVIVSFACKLFGEFVKRRGFSKILKRVKVIVLREEALKVVCIRTADLGQD